MRRPNRSRRLVKKLMKRANPMPSAMFAGWETTDGRRVSLLELRYWNLPIPAQAG